MFKVQEKKDLKVGDVVELRNGDKLLVLNEEKFSDLSSENNNDIFYFDHINNNLTYNGDDRNQDIIKVERPIEYEIVYNREDTVREMTVEEVSKILGYEIKIIKEDI